MNVRKLHIHTCNYFQLSSLFNFKLSSEIYYVKLILNFKVTLLLLSYIRLLTAKSLQNFKTRGKK